MVLERHLQPILIHIACVSEDLYTDARFCPAVAIKLHRRGAEELLVVGSRKGSSYRTTRSTVGVLLRALLTNCPFTT